MGACGVDRTRRALHEAWRAAERGPRPLRSTLAHAARLAGEVAQGRAKPGHVAALEAVARDLEALDPLVSRMLADTLRVDADEWRAHIEEMRCPDSACFRRPPAPCQAACPAHIDIPDFLALIGKERYQGALRVITADSPLPYSCGLVCPAPCESACLRGSEGSALFIRPMKAVAAEHALADGGDYPLPVPAPPTGKRVAVVGSGPAGMTAAWYLTTAGHRVEIFEAAARSGGMMRYGIPAYRLPSAVLDREFDNLKALGASVHVSHPVEDIAALRSEGFDAVFAAIGLQQSRRLPLPGADLPFVIGGVDFLRAVREDENPRVGPRALVIGGGNVAIDVALTALRQGAREVTLVCLERRDEMPANPAEVHIAVSESVDVRNAWGPVSVGADHAVVFQRCLSVFGAGRRFAPTFDPAEQIRIEADHVLLAVGQSADLGAAGKAIAVERGLIVVDRATLATSAPGVFAGGDVAHGPRTVVEAVRAGKQAAAAIESFLTGKPMSPDWDTPKRRDRSPPLAALASERSRHDRPEMPECAVSERTGDYRPIELGLTDAMARHEAARCLRCDLCIGCGLCELACSEVGAEALRMTPTKAGRLAFDDFTRPAELCLGCGACAAVCPVGAIGVADHDGVRDTVITGTVVRRQALIECPSCGRTHVAENLWTRLRGGPTPAIDAHCPECRRLRLSRAMASNALAPLRPAGPADLV